MSATTSISKQLFDCPACGKAIAGRFAIEFELSGKVDGSDVEMKGHVVGVSVSHDCTPKVTR